MMTKTYGFYETGPYEPKTRPLVYCEIKNCWTPVDAEAGETMCGEHKAKVMAERERDE
jgi:hypothetical protein